MISIEILLLLVIAAAMVAISMFALIGLGVYIVKSFFSKSDEERTILMVPPGMGPPRESEKENGNYL